MITKVCRDCHKEVEIDNLCPDKACSYGVKALCKPCGAERMRKQRAKPHSKHKENKRKSDKRLRVKVLNHYGNRCVECGERHYEFLAIDHINDNGAEHKRTLSNSSRFADGHSVYRDIIKNGFPNTYQILCHNCNSSKQYYKYNPILREKEQLQITEGFMGEGI